MVRRPMWLSSSSSFPGDQPVHEEHPGTQQGGRGERAASAQVSEKHAMQCSAEVSEKHAMQCRAVQCEGEGLASEFELDLSAEMTE